MANPEYLGSGQPDGENLGRSGGKIGFYGLATPIAKQTITQLATTKTTTQLRAEVTAIENALAALGIITVD